MPRKAATKSSQEFSRTRKSPAATSTKSISPATPQHASPDRERSHPSSTSRQDDNSSSDSGSEITIVADQADSDDAFEIESIIGINLAENKVYVKWVGFLHPSWTSVENLTSCVDAKSTFIDAVTQSLSPNPTSPSIGDLMKASGFLKAVATEVVDVFEERRSVLLYHLPASCNTELSSNIASIFSKQLSINDNLRFSCKRLGSPVAPVRVTLAFTEDARLVLERCGSLVGGLTLGPYLSRLP
ncbi:hypothetical protein Ciccas_013953, partial [Cichlidogyrus casuarinus]